MNFIAQLRDLIKFYLGHYNSSTKSSECVLARQATSLVILHIRDTGRLFLNVEKSRRNHH
ncbi:hypothetical protein X798_05586 [Onchocerca flexuosa]|uniref:Uncharacterized protein n=2 Tax=Onchocerca flexuosa TaxID=387005 RepID=A0A183I1U6_9BILA|nr:hypothetical protein X798_05586 [Onchocerca flexuosa]VDP14459.1 unnamed protein product [Onchocerca flexuosa]